MSALTLLPPAGLRHGTRRAATTVRRLMRTVAVSALIGVVPAVQAQLFSDDEARRAILDVRSRVEQMQRELTKRLDEMQSRVDRLEQTTRGQLDLQNQIQAMRQEIAGLRGQIEVQTNELAQTQRRQRDLSTDIDSRIKRFEPVAVTIDGKPHNVDVAERRAFEGALAIFRSGDFRAAQTALQQFQGAYPQSPYGPGAQYWIGSSQYAQKDNKGAISTLLAFVQRHPDHPRAADALLTVGNAQAESGDRKAAADTFRTVTERYDGSGAAQTARERLTAVGTPVPPTPAPTAPKR
jgi:tol-pal system protein YbgF